ncbi:tetratricopeptide repeat protein [Maribacter sp.]|nr:tetratricopeptide repeat protein [Maribacter sp.]
MKNLTLLLLFCVAIVFSQNEQKIDSLIKIIEETKVDSIQANCYLELSSLTMYNNQTKTKQYLEKAQNLYSNSKNGKGLAKFFAQKATYFYGLGQIDSARHYLDNSVKKYLEIKDTLRAAVIRHNIGILDNYQGNSQSATEIMKINIPVFKKYYDTVHLGNAYLMKGNIAMTEGFYKIALAETYNALKEHKNIGDDLRIAEDLLQIGRIYNYTGDDKKAITTFKESIEIYEKIENLRNIAQTLNYMADSQIKLKNYEIAEKNLKESLLISEKLQYKANIARVYKNLGKIEFEKGNLNKSIAYLNDSYHLWKSIGSASNEATSLAFLGKSYAKNKEYAKAIECLDQSITISIDKNYPNILQTAYLEKSIVLEKTKKYQASLINFKLNKKVSDSIYGIERIKATEELKTIYETEKKEVTLALQGEEINTLNEKARADKFKKGLYAGGMTSALALSGLLIFGFRQRTKKNKIAREKQEVIYKQEIAHKKKELTSQTLHLVQKNTFIQELMENFENIKNSPEKFKMEFRRIVMLLKKENASDKDWEVFKTYFAEVHNDFDQKLKTLYADISEKEIRLAAFLRMNLTTKEIAATLNVLPDSILKSKYRLKKKLNLDKETDLTGFLNTL